MIIPNVHNRHTIIVIVHIRHVKFLPARRLPARPRIAQDSRDREQSRKARTRVEAGLAADGDDGAVAGEVPPPRATKAAGAEGAPSRAPVRTAARVRVYVTTTR